MKVHHSDMVDGLIDGHLKGWRRWLAQRHVSRCPICALEYRHQGHVSRMLQDHKPQREMPESGPAFWARVKSEIESAAAATAATPAPALPRLSFRDWLSEHPALVPATALAALVIIGGVFWLTRPATPAGSVPQLARHEPPVATRPYAAVEHVETTIPDAVATPFRSEEAGVTVIWVSGLPWTEDMTEMQTLFANWDT
jgi:hypothetical protein